MNSLLLSLLLAACPVPTEGPAQALAIEPPGVLASMDLERLKGELRDENDRTRRKAVQGLIELDSEEAWDLVLDALEDPVARVADEAQLGLAKLPEGLHDELFGKRGLQSKRGIVALRVAEALGRMEVVFKDKQYARGLNHKDPQVRRSTLWSLERLARREVLANPSKDLIKQLRKLAQKDKQESVQAQALVTLAALDSREAAPFALDFLAAKSAVKRTAAMEMVRLIPGPGRLQALRMALTDPAFSVRLSAYESAQDLGTLEAMGFLVDALEKEPRARCAWRLVDLLRTSTGMKYGRDPRPWRDWFAKQPADWKAEPKESREELGDEGTTALVGMRVISDRLTFLIDFSGSMWKETNGVSLKQRVDVEMRKALEGLRPEVVFNVQPYATESLRWSKKPMAASPRNVGKALAFFEDCKLQGKGDFWSAMRIALEDEEVDTLMLLGDGAPTGGDRWNMDLMKDLFAHENRFRRVALDSLLVGSGGFVTSRWEIIARESGGRCMKVDI